MSEQNPKAGIPQIDPKEVTGQFDHLATRDPQAMEQTLQRPEYEGAQSAAPLVGSATTAAVVPAAGLGAVGLESAAAANAHVAHLENRNPDYTPPSQVAPPHPDEHPADLPAAKSKP